MSHPLSLVSDIAVRPTKHRISIMANIDYTLVGTWLVICMIGLVMVASASISIADKNFGNPFHYLERQALYFVTGFVLGFVCLRIPLSVWEKTGPVALVIAYLLLGLVLVPGIGKTVNGSTRWIPVGPINVQVSEMAKLCLIIYMSGYLVRRDDEVKGSFRGFIIPITLLIVSGVLLLLEPDFGAATVLAVTSFGMLFLAGARLWQFGLSLGMAVLTLGLIAVTSPYRMARLTAFLNPWDDPFNTGFQLTQSLIAIGRGEWFGVGLGNSIQKLFYLPEAHTDFVFAVYAEEFGLIGVALVLVLFGYLLLRAFQTGLAAEKQGKWFGAYLSYGIGLWIGMQALVNIGVNMGLFPTKGLTLPFMSYGGSSLAVMCMAFGLLLRIDFEVRKGSVSARKVGGRHK